MTLLNLPLFHTLTTVCFSKVVTQSPWTTVLTDLYHFIHSTPKHNALHNNFAIILFPLELELKFSHWLTCHSTSKVPFTHSLSKLNSPFALSRKGWGSIENSALDLFETYFPQQGTEPNCSTQGPRQLLLWAAESAAQALDLTKSWCLSSYPVLHMCDILALILWTESKWMFFSQSHHNGFLDLKSFQLQL